MTFYRVFYLFRLAGFWRLQFQIFGEVRIWQGGHSEEPQRRVPTKYHNTTTQLTITAEIHGKEPQPSATARHHSDEPQLPQRSGGRDVFFFVFRSIFLFFPFNSVFFHSLTFSDLIFFLNDVVSLWQPFQHLFLYTYRVRNERQEPLSGHRELFEKKMTTFWKKGVLKTIKRLGKVFS